MHDILRCDTTYGIYGIGKKAALKLASTSSPFRGYAQVFHNPQASNADLIFAGEDALVALCKGCPGDKLDLLRLQKFHKKVIVSKSVVCPKGLPQTTASATYHSLRVYPQVQQWMGRDHMNPEHWGCYGQRGHYFPCLMIIPLQLTCLKWCDVTAMQVAIPRGVHAGHMGLNVPLHVDTAVGCEAMLTICWMMATDD